MTPFDNIKLKDSFEKDEINRITALSPPREKAFFTIMRQSGLTPNTIKHLTRGDLEPDLTAPCKIDFPERDLKPPAFVGEEAVNYLVQYLATRKNVTPESLLFTGHKNQNEEIDTKYVSKVFRLLAERVAIGKTNRPRLFSLVTFYRNNAKHYLKELKNHPFEDDEFYMTLYKQHALPFLEIEKQITVQIRAPSKWFHGRIENQNKQINELKRTVVRDNEYIGSILSLLYDNKGDWDTGENVKLGDNFIKLWQKASDLQLTNNVEFLNGRSQYIPCVDILEELTKTLQNILKPYEELEKTSRRNIRPNKRNSKPR